VSVFEPDPSDNADLVVISCNASEAATKTESSGNARFSSVISWGMTGSDTLDVVRSRQMLKDTERTYSPFEYGIQAWY